MHLVLARQYRPILFSDVIGQDIFITLLRNALSQNRVGHAFLLTGIRGVGKTTLARLMARAITCAQRTDEQEPCNVCASCMAVLQDKHMDIVEMDAASHTGVDDIRQILEGSSYKPIMSAHKIYIIDEVHMLSKSAFNALLKLLEEPPAHVKFILATTEQSKIPATVVSRCQQMHLRRLAPHALCQLLDAICQKEGFQANTQALEALCQYSEGSARDALSLLEKTLVSLGKRRTIERADIDATLGLIPQDTMNHFVDAIESHQMSEILDKAKTFYHQGIEPTAILRQILTVIHERTLGEKKLSQTAGIKPCYRLGTLDRLWQISQKGLEEIATSPFPFLSLEMILMRLAYVGIFPTPGQLLDIIEGQEITAQAPSQSPQQNSLHPVSTPSSPAEKAPQAAQSASSHKDVSSAEQIKDTVPSAILPCADDSVPATTQAQRAPPLPTPSSDNDPPPSSIALTGHESFPLKILDSHSPEGQFFADLNKRLGQAREALLLANMKQFVSFVSWDSHKGALCLHWTGQQSQPENFTATLKIFISQWQGKPCHVSWTDQGVYLPQSDQDAKAQNDLVKSVEKHPNIIDLKEAFPDLSIQFVAPLPENGDR